MEKSSGNRVVGHIIFDGLEVSFDLAHSVGVLGRRGTAVKLEFVELIQ